MLGHCLASALVVALLAAGFAAPSTARAQDSAAAPCLLCGPAIERPTESNIQSALKLDIQTRLDFDRVVFNGEGEAFVSLAPDGGVQILGAATASGARAMPGSVAIRGEPGRQVRVELPPRIDLVGEYGGSVRIDRIVTDLPTFPRIGDDGLLTFRFGGDVRISGETDGNYRGAVDFIIDYL